MRNIRCFFTVLLLLILLTNDGIVALAMNTGFSTEELSEKDKDTILANINISVLKYEPPKKTIECFDVNENGLIAIGCEDSVNKTIGIYTSDGVFQYGYKFKDNGSFGVEWDGDNIIIYFVRGDIAATVNTEGKVENILEIQNTIENNSYWNHFVFSTKRKVGDIEYTLKNDMGVFNIFASSYSQLVVTNASEEERVIYDVNATHFFNIIVVFVGILLFGYLVVRGVFREFMKQKQRT